MRAPPGPARLHGKSDKSWQRSATMHVAPVRHSTSSTDSSGCTSSELTDHTRASRQRAAQAMNATARARVARRTAHSRSSARGDGSSSRSAIPANTHSTAPATIREPASSPPDHSSNSDSWNVRTAVANIIPAGRRPSSVPKSRPVRVAESEAVNPTAQATRSSGTDALLSNPIVEPRMSPFRKKVVSRAAHARRTNVWTNSAVRMLTKSRRCLGCWQCPLWA